MSDDLRVADLHGCVAPAAELLYEHSGPQLRGYWPHVEERLLLTSPTPGVGDWDSSYVRFATRRELERSRRDDARTPTPAPFPPASGADADVEPALLHDNPAGRLRALDRAGVAVQLLSPGASLDAALELGVNPAVGVLAAYNRWVRSYCEADPQRLKAVLQVHGGEPQWSAREIRDAFADPAVAAVTIHLPVKVAPDERNFWALWDALEETGLGVLHRPGASARVWRPHQLASYLARTGVLARWGVPIAFAGWPDGWLEPWAEQLAAPAPAAREALAAYAQAGRLLAVTERLDERDEALARLDALAPRAVAWGSGFPFGPLARADALRRAREHDGLQRRALAENPWTYLPAAAPAAPLKTPAAAAGLQ
ncbi:MAG: amidohydrolase family protein [Actinobacteria bacterium]|nr:amidohydrolase family protein [Actinomycetota bacterium]